MSGGAGGRPARDQDGTAVVMALGVVALLVAVALVCTGVVALVLAHRRAQDAADLAALAGAARGADCSAAARIARANRAEVVDCVRDGSAVTVTVAVAFGLAGSTWTVLGRARAGPVFGVAGGPG